MYVVITYNQASHQPELATYGLYDDLDEAQAERDEQEAATRTVGRGERHVVAEVIPVDENDS